MFALGGGVLSNVLSLARGVLIARLLIPSEVGRFALVAAVLGGLETMTYPGLYDAVVQAAAPTRRMLSVAWTMLVCRGLLLATILFASSNVIAEVFSAPDVAPLLRWMALVPLILATTSMSLALRRRQMDIKSVTTNTLFGALINTLVSLGAAAALHSASALVLGAIAGAVVQVLASYSLGAFRPRISFALREIADLLSFSRWRFVWGVGWYLSTQLDDLVVGRVLGMQALGFYRVGYRIAYFPSSASTGALAQVAFPSMAMKFRQDHESAALAYGRYVSLVASFAFPVGFYFAAVSDSLVLILLGETWRAASVPVAIISIAAAIRAVTGTGSALFLAIGQPALSSALEVVRALALALGLSLIFPFGLVGAAGAALISSLATIPVWMRGCRAALVKPSRLMPILKRVPLALVPAVAGGSLEVAWESPSSIFISAPIGFGCYLLLVKRWNQQLWDEWMDVLRKLRNTTNRDHSPE